MKPAIEAVCERIGRAAELAPTCDVGEMLDQVAVEAFCALYPSEVPSMLNLLNRKRRRRGTLEQHVLDAFALAPFAGDDLDAAEGA